MLDVTPEKVSKSGDESINENEEARTNTAYINDIDLFNYTNENEYFGIPNVQEAPSTKKKEKKKKKKNNRFSNNVPNDIRDDPVMLKYWFKRFSLFSKFDQGITLDRGNNFCATFN